VLNYPGKKVPEVTPVYDHDILVDGFFTIESYDEEHHVRAKIQKMIERKQRYSFDFTSVSITDFDFVRVSNKKARVPDGSVPYDASAIAKVYQHGAIYVRLNKSFKVNILRPGLVSL